MSGQITTYPLILTAYPLLRENVKLCVNIRISSFETDLKYMKKLVLRRVAECLCTLAVLAAPVASEFCRALFCQERDPDGMEEFVKKIGK